MGEVFLCQFTYYIRSKIFG